MTLEIGHLNVKVTVNQAKSEGGEGSSGNSSETDSGNKPSPEQLGQDIIEQMIKIIEDKQER